MLKKLFVYGSLRTGCYNYDKYLTNKVKSSKIGTIKGDLYHIENKGYPALIDGTFDIYGELMEFYDYENVIGELDELEGYNEFTLNDSNYIRKEVVVTFENGESEVAYGYIYNLECSENKDNILLKVNCNDWIKYIDNKQVV